ncbi:MAG: DNA polymerase III subunit delta' [Planctomycetota bacterium]
MSEVVGHQNVVERLGKALSEGRLAHGLLFAGPTGVGKRTTANWLSKRFLGDTPDVHRRIDAGTHGDFHVVTRQLVRNYDKTGKSKAIQFTIDVVRGEIVAPANRASIEGDGKVFVVEEAETMNPAAQNALLKTLEEPYGRTLIVLLTDNPMRLLPTIRSRCQTFAFGELTKAETTEVLARHEVTAVDADAAYEVAGGSPGRALSFLRTGVVARRRELVDRLQQRQPIADFLVEAAGVAAEAALEDDPLGSKDAFTRDGFRLWLGLAADHVRRDFAADPESACDAIEAMHRAERYLLANVNRDLVLRQLDLTLVGRQKA